MFTTNVNEENEGRRTVIAEETDFTMDQLERLEDDLLTSLWETLLKYRPDLRANADYRARSVVANQGTERLPMPPVFE